MTAAYNVAEFIDRDTAFLVRRLRRYFRTGTALDVPRTVLLLSGFSR
jgi:hypothetical protein